MIWIKLALGLGIMLVLAITVGGYVGGKVEDPRDDWNDEEEE
jgi:hypothetical protein